MLKRIIPFFLKTSILLLSVGVFSCNDDLDEIDESKAQLHIHVFALLTSNPKENATVTVHLTEADANNNVKAVVKKRFTDNDGNVTFRNLEPGKRYWIRAKVVVDKTVNQTDELVAGDNFHEVGTL